MAKKKFYDSPDWKVINLNVDVVMASGDQLIDADNDVDWGGDW